MVSACPVRTGREHALSPFSETKSPGGVLDVCLFGHGTCVVAQLVPRDMDGFNPAGLQGSSKGLALPQVLEPGYRSLMGASFIGASIFRFK